MLTTPVFTGTLAGTYGQNFDWGRFEATGTVYHSSGYRWEFTDSVTTSPYSLLGANLTFSPNANRFKYTLYGKNLANKAYVQGALPTAATSLIFWNSAARNRCDSGLLVLAGGSWIWRVTSDVECPCNLERP